MVDGFKNWIKLGDAVTILMKRHGWPEKEAVREVKRAVLAGTLQDLAKMHGADATEENGEASHDKH